MRENTYRKESCLERHALRLSSSSLLVVFMRLCVLQYSRIFRELFVTVKRRINFRMKRDSNCRIDVLVEVETSLC